MSDANAIIITGGLLDTNNAKTAHGLIRGTDRFNIVGVVDSIHAVKDAGVVSRTERARELRGEGKQRFRRQRSFRETIL